MHPSPNANPNPYRGDTLTPQPTPKDKRAHVDNPAVTGRGRATSLHVRALRRQPWVDAKLDAVPVHNALQLTEASDHSSSNQG